MTPCDPNIFQDSLCSCFRKTHKDFSDATPTPKLSQLHLPYHNKLTVTTYEANHTTFVKIQRTKTLFRRDTPISFHSNPGRQVPLLQIYLSAGMEAHAWFQQSPLWVRIDLSSQFQENAWKCSARLKAVILTICWTSSEFLSSEHWLSKYWWKHHVSFIWAAPIHSLTLKCVTASWCHPGNHSFLSYLVWQSVQLLLPFQDPKINHLAHAKCILCKKNMAIKLQISLFNIDTHKFLIITYVNYFRNYLNCLSSATATPSEF